jgi:hypothetical protein
VDNALIIIPDLYGISRDEAVDAEQQREAADRRSLS